MHFGRRLGSRSPVWPQISQQNKGHLRELFWLFQHLPPAVREWSNPRYRGAPASCRQTQASPPERKIPTDSLLISHAAVFSTPSNFIGFVWLSHLLAPIPRIFSALFTVFIGKKFNFFAKIRKRCSHFSIAQQKATAKARWLSKWRVNDKHADEHYTEKIRKNERSNI